MKDIQAKAESSDAFNEDFAWQFLFIYVFV